MIEMKHTQGLWEAKRLIRGVPKVVTKQGLIAECGGGEHSEIIANAHLMAAAPELFVACGNGRNKYSTLPQWLNHIAEMVAGFNTFGSRWPETAKLLHAKADEIDAALVKANGGKTIRGY